MKRSIFSRLALAALASVSIFSAPSGARAADLLSAAEPAKATPAAPARVSANFDSDGVKIHYIIQGQGEPVILIHGLTASIAMNWELPGLVADLSKNYQVIALDCRGHGQSDKPTHEGDYGQKMVDDVLRLMDHLHVAKARFVGYSMGGMITMKILTTHPERVTSAVIGGMGWVRDGSQFDSSWQLGQLRPQTEGKATSSFVACVRGFADFALAEEAVKVIKVPVDVIVGDQDPLRRLYVQPLQKIPPRLARPPHRRRRPHHLHPETRFQSPGRRGAGEAHSGFQIGGESSACSASECHPLFTLSVGPG